jgi:ADP-ribose pyrophosphatase
MCKYNLDKINKLIESVTYKSLEKIPDEGSFIKTETYRVELKDGESFIREKISKNNGDGSAIVIIPIFENGDVMLCVEPRVFTETGVGVGFPSGYIEKGEDVVVAAKRELLEETGITASSVINLGGHHQDSGNSAAFNTALVAFDCKVSDSQHLDDSEYIKNYRCSLDEAFYLLDEGLITDANSVVALLKLYRYMKENDICLMQ